MNRLTGGLARGRVLREPVPPGVRPTSSRVREALFSMLGQDLRGQRILDAFGGAGLVGLEAWSRGAEVVVVERDPKVLASLIRRGQEVGASWTVRRGDVLRLAPKLGTFDGIFADPPYAVEPTRVVALLAEQAESWLVLEARSERTCPDTAGDLSLSRHRVYGKSALWVYDSSGRSPDSR